MAALAVVAGALALRPAPMARPAKLALDVMTPPVIDPQDLASFALSPDGTQVVATGVVDGRSQLFLRGLDSATSRPVPGTAGGMYPFWSPDGRSLAFFLDGNLLRLDFDAGLVRPLTKATVGVGGIVESDGTILFAPTPASPIFRTSSDGGTPVAVTAFAAGHAGHAFPHFLPDGRHFLYFVVGSPDARGVYVGQLDGSATRRLFDADAPAVYTAGHLLFVRNGTLYAQPFDTAQLEVRGSASPVADDVMANTGYYVTVPPGGVPWHSAPARVGGSGSSCGSTAPAARSNGSANPMTATPSARRRRPMANASPSSGVARPIRTSGCSTPGAAC